LYYADQNKTYYPNFYSQDERFRLIANNPVAGAKFFKMMVDLFLKHVLGINSKNRGLYGDTSGYYGTVEQQGRLTLHLHMLLWIANSLTPQEVRDRLLDPTSDFQTRMVQYLESVHMGEFTTGTMEQVQSVLEKEAALHPNRIPSTLTLPKAAPEQCITHHNTQDNTCKKCQASLTWWEQFKTIVDEILFKSNRHKCHSGCTDPKYNSCKARFPRDVFVETAINPETGSLNIKKGEAWLNTFTDILTYLMRCNTDVTSLLSGTAIKSTVAYVTDYITKTPLKTHTMFEAIKTVFNRNSEFINGNLSCQEKTRKLMIQIVNTLTVQGEVGGPMACMYLLGHPDHYTSHMFRPFFWKAFVHEANKSWEQPQLEDSGDVMMDKVILHKVNGNVIGLSPVMDYLMRPTIFKDMCLYDWIRLITKRKMSKSEKSRIKYTSESDNDMDVDSLTEDDAMDVDDVLSHSDDMAMVDDPLDCNYFPEGKRNGKLQKVIQFLKGHPQWSTHTFTVSDESAGKVPCFVGGTIPRPDSGDRGEYCLAMLTLFRPWRSGLDLKLEGESWEDAFHGYKFTQRQQDIMKFFNIRYECNEMQ